MVTNQPPIRDLEAAFRATAILDEQTFRQAVLDHGPAIYRYAASRVGPAGAEDVMAETFAAAWRSRVKFVDRRENGLEAWLIAITTVIISAHRRAEQHWLRMCADTARVQAQRALEEDEMDRADARLDAETLMRRARVAESIVQMPRHEREPLLLHTLNNMSYSTISNVLNIPIGTVRSRISRARARLATDARRGEGRR